MRAAFIFISLMISGVTFAQPEAHAIGRVALVYRGPGSCGGEDDCSGAAAALAAKMGLEIRYVSPKMIKPEIFRDAILWIQPGGNAIDASRAIGIKRMQLIREFVYRGGGYVGFCAGMFFTDRTVDNPETIPGLGIIPAPTADYNGDKGKDGTIIQINWKGQVRDVFFNGGGYVVTTQPNLPIRVTSVYEDGTVASMESRFGNGNISVSGFHPEATEEWKKYAVGHDQDGSDQDMVADMLRWALKLRR